MRMSQRRMDDSLGFFAYSTRQPSPPNSTSFIHGVGSVGIGYLIFQIIGCDIGIQPDVDFRRLAAVHDAIGFGYGQSFFETPLAQAHRIGLAAALGEDYRRLTAQSVVAVHLDAYFAVARARCREQGAPTPAASSARRAVNAPLE